MEVIAENVYIEDNFPGVTLGVISTPRGLVFIDAPPSPEDSRTWRAAAMNLGAGPERVLIHLDSHPDRTIGARAMDCPVIAHEKTIQAFRGRPMAFKTQGDEIGAGWEGIASLGAVRWVLPEISFTHDLSLYWGDHPIQLQHRPGPTADSIWVVLPVEKVVFVGDLVVKQQPPFLAQAALPLWIEALNELTSPAYDGFTILSGRGGVVTAQMVTDQREVLKEIHAQLERLAARGAGPESTEDLIGHFLEAYQVSSTRLKQYEQRLRYGLHQYYVRHYRLSQRSNQS